MSFCSFSKEYLASGKTQIDNVFITNILPELDANALKVYLYGLYLCQNPYDINLKTFANSLNMSENEVVNYFTYLEEFSLCSILSTDPFTITYYPTTTTTISKVAPSNSEKYADFNKSLQLLVPERMIPTSEYRVYMQLLEESNMQKEALLIIVKFCVDIKGPKISYKYILKVANDFISRNVLTEESVEKELDYYFTILNLVKKVFEIAKFTKKPDFEDLNLYIKWIQKFGFTDKFILEVCENRKPASVKSLDKILEEIYFNDSGSTGKKKKDTKDKSFDFKGQRNIDNDTLKSLVDNPDNVEVWYGWRN